ncbi:hypothetical protein QUF90_17510 [Desulfococcaceae bacterium HSG9]|nr:hypothetical protein [Desulfococcaceae bacterium HSG9]
MEIKNIVDDMQHGVVSKMPSEIEQPIRTEHCPAAVVCKSLGNMRAACVKGGNVHDSNNNLSACVASLVIMLSKINDKLPEEKIKEIQD